MHKVIMLLDNDFKSDNRVEKEANTLISHGYSVEILCVKNENLPSNDERNHIKITRIIDPIVTTRPFSTAARKNTKMLLAYLEKEQFDVLHCHDYTFIHILAQLKKTNKKFVGIYDSHEYFSEFQFYKNIPSLKNRLKAYLVWRLLIQREKKSAAKCDGLITPTEYIRKQLSQRFHISTTISLRNIPESQTFQPSNFLHDKYQLENDSKIIVHTGNIYFEPSYIQTIYATLKEFKERIYFVFFIDRTRALQHKAFVNTHQLNDKIFFLDYPPKDKIISYLASADIGFSWINHQFKSHYYTSANRYWEYTMAQLPVLSNPQWEIQQEIKQHQHGIIYSSLKEGIELILNDQKTYKKNAISASHLNSWEKESDKLVAFYNALVH